ncbi:MAG: WXG100 family type VII secretion target [Lachnospiraceae bacterium]|nr:WXG100 family type VII secretion target [Lachnospiraceae bacterium]
MAQISIDIDRALQDAARIQEIAAAIKRLASDNVEKSAAITTECWKSEQSAQYMKKMEKLQKNLNTIGKNLDGIAALYKAEAEAMRDAERFGEQLANIRIYR